MEENSVLIAGLRDKEKSWESEDDIAVLLFKDIFMGFHHMIVGGFP